MRQRTWSGAPLAGRSNILPAPVWTAKDKRAQLRRLLEADSLSVAPGAYDAVSAAAISSAGFPIVHATGAGIACALGYPDIGLLGMSEVANQVRGMIDVTAVPLIADVDTGYGNHLNAIRTIRQFEALGVSGLHIEDQTYPKKCGLLHGREVIPIEEMVIKLRAAIDAREDPNLVIIARTDARDVLGLEAVIERGRAFFEAGADMVFVYGARSLDELGKIAESVRGPLMTHVSRGSSFYDVSHSELKNLGYKIVIHALSPLEVAIKAVTNYLQALRQEDATMLREVEMASYEELYGLVGLPGWLETEKAYQSEANGQ